MKRKRTPNYKFLENHAWYVPGVGGMFGLLLWLLPGSVISLSTKYQLDLLPGLAYIPVHFSYFGIGIVIFEVLLLAEKLIKQDMLRLFLCGAGCAMLLLSMQDNRHISAMLDDIFL